MFTGIVEEVGVLGQTGRRMKVLCRAVLEGASIGSSIAVNGTCLTVVQLDQDGFWADLSPETLSRTNFSELGPGSLVNLERPLVMGGRLDGHMVQGHVDGTAVLDSLRELPDGNWWLEVRVPDPLDRYLIVKGSIALDGISLTIAGLKDGLLAVAIIPHTYQATALRDRHSGQRLNVEVDLIAKYVEKMTAHFARDAM